MCLTKTCAESKTQVSSANGKSQTSRSTHHDHTIRQGVFWTPCPPYPCSVFSTNKKRPNSQSDAPLYVLRDLWNRSSGWKVGIFHFGTEQGERESVTVQRTACRRTRHSCFLLLRVIKITKDKLKNGMKMKTGFLNTNWHSQKAKEILLYYYQWILISLCWLKWWNGLQASRSSWLLFARLDWVDWRVPVSPLLIIQRENNKTFNNMEMWQP